MTKQQLHDLIDQYIIENTQGRITATQVNEILSDLVDSLKSVQPAVTPEEGSSSGVAQGQYVEQVTQDTEGVINVIRKKLPGGYSLPTMNATTKGGAKLGNGLEVDNDVLSVKPRSSHNTGIDSATTDWKTKLLTGFTLVSGLSGIDYSGINASIPAATVTKENGQYIGTDGYMTGEQAVELQEAIDFIDEDCEEKSNKVTSLSPSSTDIQYPSAKAVYDQLLTKLGTTGTAYNTAAIPFAQVDNTSTSTAFTATVPGITQLKDGTCVMLHNGVVTSESGFTLNVNGLGAHPAFNNMTEATRDTTIFNVAYTMLFVYDATRVVDGITGAWCCYRGYDNNTNTIGYQLRTNSTALPMQSKTYRYRILFTSADGAHFVPANNSSSTNATAVRTVCQDPIDPFGKIVYYGTTASVDVGSRPSASNLWSQYTLSLGYSFNTTGAELTLTLWKPVYVKCAPQTNGSAIIDSTTPYVQDLPTTEDGKIYIFLGIAYDATHIELYQEHPVYYYKDGAIRLWTNTAEVDISGKENTSNKVTSLSSASTDAQYPSAKCVYDLVGDIETLLASI